MTDKDNADKYDVVIVGGGPGGLAAALMLGRVRRRVLLSDTGEARNSRVDATHGFFTRDGIAPAELRRIARDQLEPYPDVKVRNLAIEDVHQDNDGFAVTLADGQQVQSRRVLLATGLVDDLPALDGLAEVWGRTAFHCPYCDGWETQGQKVAVIGEGDGVVDMAVQLVRHTPDTTIYSNGTVLSEWANDVLAAHGIGVRTESITGLARDGDQVKGVILRSGKTDLADLVFMGTPSHQRSDLAGRLGCETLEDGAVTVDDLWRTTVPGVYAVGDMARKPAFPIVLGQIVFAAAGGHLAAAAIDQELFLADVPDLPSPLRDMPAGTSGN